MTAPETAGQAAYEALHASFQARDPNYRFIPWAELYGIVATGRLIREDYEAAAQAAIAAAAPAPAGELAMLRADLADYEKLLAKWPKCPAGCNCRIGLPDDADANECGCDGPCNGGAAPAPAGEGGAREALAEIEWLTTWAFDNDDDTLSIEHVRDLARKGLRGQPQAAPARQALEEAVEHAIHVTPAGSGTSAVMRAVDAYVFARSREAPGLARAETATVKAAGANTARDLAALAARWEAEAPTLMPEQEDAVRACASELRVALRALT